MPRLSFRSKLLAAMMAVVLGVAGATFVVAQQRFQHTYAELFGEFFRARNQAFAQRQEAFLAPIQRTCDSIVRSRRFQNAIHALDEGGTPEEFDDQVWAEFETRKMLPEAGDASGSTGTAFYLFLNSAGEIIPPAARALPGFKPLAQQDRLRAQLSHVRRAYDRMESPLVGYLSLLAPGQDVELCQAIFTRIDDSRSGDVLGVMVLGFRVTDLLAGGGGERYGFRSGIWFEDTLFAPALGAGARAEAALGLGQRLHAAGGDGLGSFDTPLQGELHRVFFQTLASDPDLPRGRLVAFFSMTEALRAQRDLRWRVVSVGSLGVLGALLVSAVLSHGLSVPVRELVSGTLEIQRGHFDIEVPVRSRDELGLLAGSFNEMARGLALKEKYRSVLDKVADPKVASELMSGGVALGGERREISVLFCDIRGFTALTQGMDPVEVVRMLNEHFTPLTRVVNEHHGVVDKFVGDLIMAVFGAPKSYGNDAANAAGCALAMIRERRALNETSHYRIEMGIGVASGPALAGCMGSSDRLNYTVLGERVNLASRLCSKAGRMEVVIDRTTRERLGARARVEALEELELKGFTGRVPAFRLLGLEGATS